MIRQTERASSGPDSIDNTARVDVAPLRPRRAGPLSTCSPRVSRYSAAGSARLHALVHQLKVFLWRPVNVLVLSPGDPGGFQFRPIFS